MLMIIYGCGVLNWSSFAHKEQFLGRGAMNLQVGDSIWIIPDLPGLAILRYIERDNYYRFIGTAYVHGFKDGEALELLESGGSKLQGLILE